MKTPMKNFGILFAVLFMAIGLSSHVYANNNHPDNMLLPVDKKGKYAILNVSSLPMDKEVTIRVRDNAERLVDEFKVKNTGTEHLMVNFNRLKPGMYSLIVIRGENDVVRKNLNIHWNEVIVSEVINLDRDRSENKLWPFFLL